MFSRKINMVLRFKDSRNEMVVRHLVLESNMFVRSQALESGKATIPPCA